INPNYIGFYAYSNETTEPITSRFQALISSRYNYNDIESLIGESYLDIGKIYVIGLPPGWNIEIYDSGYNMTYSATAGSNSIAYIDVSSTLILGINGTLYFNITDQYGNPVYSFSDDTTIPGGSIIQIYIPIDDPMSSIMVGLHNIAERWYFVYNPNRATYSHVDTSTNAEIGVPVILGIGLYNGKAYYYICDQNYSPMTNNSDNPVTFPINGPYRIVFGSAKFEIDKITNDISTSGFYSWIRVRPFVYPEPSVDPWYEAIESLTIPNPASIEYELVSDYIVYGSTLIVDLAMVYQNNQPILVIIVEGERIS
ncbi:MAG: hypothetical protein J7L82_01590, partial [Staphylothermus sp.]|nr:hypothetical protein [Staphylothermus sp.]